MIRFIVEEIDNTVVAVGASETGLHRYKTFDVELPEVETWLELNGGYRVRRFVGIEILQQESNNVTPAGRQKKTVNPEHQQGKVGCFNSE